MAAKKIILAFWFYNLIFDITCIKEELSLKKKKECNKKNILDIVKCISVGDYNVIFINRTRK